MLFRSLVENSILLKRKDELGNLANSLNEMSKSLRVRDKKLTDYAENLENKVKERTKSLDEKTKDIQNMLGNMNLGICTVMASGAIHHEFSAHLQTILETDKISGENAVDLLFAHSNLGPDILNQVKNCIKSVIGEDSFCFDMNSHLLLKEVTISPNINTKNIELTWEAILDDDDHVEKILVIVKDVTELKRLKETADQQKREEQMVIELIRVGGSKFENFYKYTAEYMNECRNILENDFSEMQENETNTLLRNLHTIKGNSRACKFSQLTDHLHATEEIVKDSLDNKNRNKTEDILKRLDPITKLLDSYYKIYKKKLQNIGRNKEQKEINKFVHSLGHCIARVKNKEQEKKAEFFNFIDRKVESLGAKSLNEIIHESSNIKELSLELGKPAPKLVFSDSNIRFYQKKYPILIDVFMHCIRNSLDHGIETAEEREDKGKNRTGIISFTIKKQENSLEIEYWDDGRGLDIDSLRKKALENKFLTAPSASDEKVANYIFESGVSTAEKVTEISGRGVGMDAVKSFLEERNGKIDILLLSPQDSENSFRNFRFKITLPQNFYFDEDELDELERNLNI